MRNGLKRSHRYVATGILVASLLIGSLNGTAVSQPPAGYLLGPGDLLEISVWGYPDLTRQGVVGPDGEIALPLIGMIRTAGVSVERLTALIAKAYAEFIIDPHVVVTIKEYRKLHVSVLGQVAHPGSYDLPLGTRLLDLVAAGGGPTEAAALGEAQLLRPGLPAVRVDLTRAMAGEPEVNAPLAGGETLVVPEDLTSFVTVQGEVVRPGRYRLKGAMRVLDALMIAGGLTERASVTQASLARASGKTEPLLLEGLLLHQEMDRNIPLTPGDVLFIPEEVDNKIYVIGDVRNPGVFPVKGHVTLLQAIAMAGGPEQRGPGTAASAFVVRRNGNTPQEVTAGPARVTALPNGHALITADLKAITRDPSRDIPVQPGDVLVLPMTGVGAFQVIASVLAGVAYIFK
ncbi:MAG: hypothetical protein E6H04_10240 [Bacillati bacterium ANGP1]|uniref:Polysaccharide export protein n=1 Tax=Candidatus Segetimicrobium genomatis TaxID=2569760 RepID=A0A537J808_9BACT|nr:MAG: hypothetical protein E6H04_10240 [Terrabacteria group bacterium ANGP1]